MGKKAVLTSREPSLGRVFSMKGGATGAASRKSSRAKDNLHFHGDFHAIASAQNLLAALIDAHPIHGNDLHLDPDQVSGRRMSVLANGPWLSWISVSDGTTIDCRYVSPKRSIRSPMIPNCSACLQTGGSVRRMHCCRLAPAFSCGCVALIGFSSWLGLPSSRSLAGDAACIITGTGGSMGREAALTFAREGLLL